MVIIRKIEVLNSFNNFSLIRWYINDTQEDLDNYVFSVYKSLSPDSEFEKINEEDIRDFEYQYFIPTYLNSSVHWYFKVEAKNLLTNETKMSDVFGSAYFVEPDCVADSIIYQFEYFLEYILNRPPIKLLIRRRTGTRCNVCWDDEAKEVTRSQCTTCYNTSYTGGYMPPRDLRISFTEPGFIEKVDLGDIKDVQQNVTTAWASTYPLILPKDIIVDEFNRRFIVIQAQPTTKDGRIYLRQVLQLQLIPPTDVIYKFPI